MNVRENGQTSQSGYLEIFRPASLIAAFVGGVGSVYIMLMAGLRPPVFLVVLFIGWVVAPFAALVIANMISGRWSIITRWALHYLTLVLSLCSLAVYGYVLMKPRASQAAFPYVAVPLGSWLLIAIVFAVAALVSRRRSR